MPTVYDVEVRYIDALRAKLAEARAGALNGHRRAAEFQTINGHKNTEIDSLKEQLRRASNTIQTQESELARLRSQPVDRGAQP